ncbi:9598_t:CDS:2 [Entrophospora sp. SA101]|nr:3202_t:CDS:2 [Entrophospora sp. SA101]CAJ0829264.1 9598_t:CDS:2 [Entrophospora sp. SA101]CAJ0911646.1 8941_t:CDS:2 [Entrophospora sp. SA101]CAJ0927790.1 13343_t:CDS:2 [Entrophospora sp. SA101]CAJ0927792.1 13344_t:CDS:2 [Entrophospora sp. SA101]
MERNEISAIANGPPIKKRKLCKTKFIIGNNKDNGNSNDIMNELKDIVFQYENGLRKTNAIEKGLITINEKIVKTETKVKNQDIIGHKIHRHEPPITSTPINILHKENDLIVINKPASIPVHPSGRYRHNTVLHILKKEHGFSNDLHTINRLDRLTSGIMLLALSKERAKELEQQMQRRKIKKEYICRVFGKFPDGEIICEQPIKCVSHKLGLNIVDKNGKPSTTIFEKISYNKNTSVVKCKPLTGRTHQIRVHLQYLGYPIANDPLYCNKKVWGSNLGKGGINEEAGDGRNEDDNDQPSIKNIIEKLSNEVGDDDEIDLNLKKTDNEQSKEKIDLMIGDKNEESDEYYCEECNINKFPDPKPNQLLIWLHALKYEGEGWEFKTDLPDWAEDNYIVIDEN